jgi:rhomboid protease GluP
VQAASLSKNDEWRHALYDRERYLTRWVLHLPKLHLPLVTLTLIALNVAAFWLAWRAIPGGTASVETPTLDIFPLATMRSSLDSPLGWPRLLTSTFFHWSVGHLVSNMLTLYWLGRFLEPTLGRIRFLLYYLVGGVFSSIPATLVLNSLGITAGASGAVYALIGVYIAFLIVHYRVLDVDGKTRWAGLLILLVYFLYTSLAAGIYSPVNHAAHVGGLLAGIVLALLGGPYFTAAPNPADPSKLVVRDRLSPASLLRAVSPKRRG